MITIWNPLIQELVISKDRASLILAVALIDNPKQITSYVCCSSYRADKCLNLPAFPYPSEFNWWNMFYSICQIDWDQYYVSKKFLLDLKNKLGY